MKNYYFILLLILAPTLLKGQSVKFSDWVSSSPSNNWEQKTTVKIEKYNHSVAVDFEVFPDKKEQQIDGFGGCFNELGWEALKVLTVDKREQVLRDLFDPVEGCRFSICRIPIGANDYAVDWYSLDEVRNDFDMKSFNIERDRQRLIPYIKSAQKYRPDLKIWGSPWCPPSWMKTNNHYACKSDPQVNDLGKNMQGEEMKTQFRMQPSYLKAYALYFRKFIEYYAKEGIPVYAVHVQNEMNSCQNFPSCIWRPEDLNIFIGQYLGPELRKTKTELWLGTVERPQSERIKGILSDPLSSKYIKGVGFQWAGKGVIAWVHQNYAALKLMQSETECGNGSNDWAAAEYTFNLMRHYLNNGAGAYMYWNMILDETGRSQWGWKQNSMISINKSSGDVTYNPEFYLMKQLSRSVPSSYYKVKSEGPFEGNICFSSGKKLILLISNKENTPREILIKVKDHVITALLEAHSINTLAILLE